MSGTTVFYHAGCVDGFTAAWVCWREFGDDATYLPRNYGDAASLNQFEDRQVYVVDFSFDFETLEEMADKAVDLVVLDHHETEEEKLNRVRKETDASVSFADHKSGAMLAWEWFNDKTAPEVVRYVQDRDLYNFDLRDSEAINLALRSYPRDFEQWEDFYRFFPPGRLKQEGEAIERHRSRQLDRLISKSSDVEIDGFIGKIVNSPIYATSLGNELAERAEDSFGLMWHLTSGGDVKWSARALNDGPHVGKMAEQFGGGGHANAAGWRSDTAFLDRFL